MNITNGYLIHKFTNTSLISLDNYILLMNFNLSVYSTDKSNFSSRVRGTRSLSNIYLWYTVFVEYEEVVIDKKNYWNY